MFTFLLLLTGFLIGVVTTLLIGAYVHGLELKEAVNNPDPKIMSELAAYIVEHSKLKELTK